MTVDLGALAARQAIAELELSAAGFTQDQAEMGARWATRWAQGMARKLPSDQQGGSYPALFEEAMVYAPAYLDGCRRAAEKKEYRHGLRRAAKDGRFKRGLRDYGEAKAADKAWKGSIDQAESNWDRKFRPAAS